MRLVGTGAVVLAFASHHTIPLPIFLLVFWKQVGFCCHGRQGGYNGRSCAPSPLLRLCPAQPPPITSAADITQLARRWHFASWANIVSASSKSGSLENKRKIWTKIAVGKSVPYRASPCPALCIQTDLMPCRKVVPLPCRQGKHKQIAQIWQRKSCSGSWSGGCGGCSPQTHHPRQPLSLENSAAAAPESPCSFPREMLSSHQVYEQTNKKITMF